MRMKTLFTYFANLFQRVDLSTSVGPLSVALTAKGPFSVKNPPRLEHPGPPLNQAMTGSEDGSFSDSTNQ